MDNLPAHKVSGERVAITATGASIFFLPLYSPDINPIEQTFSKITAILRKATAHTLSALQAVIAEALNALPPS